MRRATRRPRATMCPTSPRVTVAAAARRLHAGCTQAARSVSCCASSRVSRRSRCDVSTMTEMKNTCRSQWQCHTDTVVAHHMWHIERRTRAWFAFTLRIIRCAGSTEHGVCGAMYVYVAHSVSMWHLPVPLRTAVQAAAAVWFSCVARRAVSGLPRAC